MQKICVTIVFAAFAFAASSLVADIAYNGSNLTEDFNSLVSSTGTFSSTIGTQAAIPGLTGFDGAKIAGNGATATGLTVSDGSGVSGLLYSFGATSATDRALGAIASGSNTMAFGFRLVNNSTNIVDSITVRLTQENWRSSTSSTGTPNTIVAAFSLNQAQPSATYLTAGGFTAVTALDLVGPTPVAVNGPLDGNNPLNQATRTFTFSGLNWTPTQQFFLRWQDFNDQGNDAGLAIDDMTINFTTVPEPSSAGLLALAVGVLGMVRRRK